MISVTGSATASFVYDGDGNRVQGIVGGVTTTYLGNYFEWMGSTSTMKKYYYAGGTRLVMRTGASTLNYLFGDHLGSQAITASATGAKLAEVRYKAWGEERYTSGTTPTTFRYTGQRSESGIGLYFYNARWYDPALSRFTQADTIVPEPGSVLGWDRYSYVFNSPPNYTDPSGHSVCEGIGTDNCVANFPTSEGSDTSSLLNFTADPGVSWNEQVQELISENMYNIAGAYARAYNWFRRKMWLIGITGTYTRLSAIQAFLMVHGGPITLHLNNKVTGYAAEVRDRGYINIYSQNYFRTRPRILIHEVGHCFRNAIGLTDTYLQGLIPYDLRRPTGFGNAESGWEGFAGGANNYQFSLSSQRTAYTEVLADQTVGWMLNQWSMNVPSGPIRHEMMHWNMAFWLGKGF